MLAGALIKSAYAAYLAYQADPTQYPAFQAAAVRATATSPASDFSRLVNDLRTVTTTDAADLANANSLATIVVGQQSNLQSLETNEVSGVILLDPQQGWEPE